MNARGLMILAFMLISAAAQASATETAALRDPTRPSANPTMATGNAAADQGTVEYVLNATQITPRKRLAIINGTQVTEGGLLGTARVLKVNHAQVTLAVQGDIVTLQLLQAKVKQPR